MTAHSRITPFVATEDLRGFTHSATSQIFSAFVGHLASAIEAERDVEHATLYAPAFNHWLRDAELAWEHAITLARAVFEAPISRPADIPLQHMARLIHFILGCETQSEFRRALNLLDRAPELFSCPGDNAISRRVSTMLATARLRFNDIAALEMIVLCPDDGDAIDQTHGGFPFLAD